MYDNFQSATDYAHDSVPFIMEGQVVATNDPDQMGRVKVWIPSLDGENVDVQSIPWADYASPFFGFTVEYPAGGVPVKNSSDAAYGFWAIPKIGATVLVFCLNANPAARFYFACTIRLHRNRSLPAGRNFDGNATQGPWGDSGNGNGSLLPIQPAFDNLREQFQSKLTAPQAISRGAFERQVAQAKNNKDGTDGYSKGAADASYLDPQTYCLVSPGRHGLIMQDHPSNSRLRLKTAEGHQIIFDDANERIYLSTAKGKTWVELDQDGHIHVFGAQSVSVRAAEDVNLFADRDVNIEAKRSINLKANESDIRMSAAGTLHVKTSDKVLISSCNDLCLETESNIKISSDKNMDFLCKGNQALTAATGIDLNGGAHIIQTGSVIHLNGPAARRATAPECPDQASSPTVVPGHEPWDRPASKTPRGPNWIA